MSAFLCFFLISAAFPALVKAQDAPIPLMSTGQPAGWWFVFKFNSKAFPNCAEGAGESCPFGGEVQDYAVGQQYLSATNIDAHLKAGGGCLGDQTTDPVGATYNEIYENQYHYVVWNDQFYNSPHIAGCGVSCSAPWAHSKGLLAWNDAGDGLVMQVTTPSWPASGSARYPRAGDGNSLGCVKDDNVLVSQHFFSLRLTKDDVVAVLTALQNASVVTDVHNPQLVNNGGPPEIAGLVDRLGRKSTSTTFTNVTLSSGVILISKPSRLHVAPWQMVSAILGGVPLRAATWWTRPEIPSTSAESKIDCWDDSLSKPGAVEIATSGQWSGTIFGLKGGPGKDANHAKIGVSTDGSHHYTILGDMNQQGTLSDANCASSQNGRGGLFYVIDNNDLYAGVSDLIKGGAAPDQ